MPETLVAGCAGRRCAAGAGRAGRGKRPALFALPGHAESGHLLVGFFTVALRTCNHGAAEDELLKILAAARAVVFVYWHSQLYRADTCVGPSCFVWLLLFPVLQEIRYPYIRQRMLAE